MRIPATLLAAGLAPALTACGLHLNTEGDGPHCEDRAETLALDEVSPLGFAPKAIVDLAISPSPWAETLTWHEGGDTDLTVTLQNPVGARFLDSVAVWPDGAEASPAIGVICEDRVALDATLLFSTADGSFDEAWTVTLESRDGLVASLFELPDPFALHGTYEVTDHIDEPDWDTVTMSLVAHFDADGTTGVLDAQVTGQEECTGDRPRECAAWAKELLIGTWGAAAQ